MASLPFDPRQVRLADEKRRLDDVNRDSDFVRVEAVGALPGRAPERFRVKFLCQGIVGIDPGSQAPIYGNEHSVLMYCDQEFPSEVPRLRWESPIWHPNVQHIEPKNVCVNRAEWLGGSGLDDLCRQLFDMAQYRNYHADASRLPYPLDQEVAKWVREYAEPRGIVDKKRGIAIDNRPFYRPTVDAERIRRIRIQSAAAEPTGPAVRRIKIYGSDSSLDDQSAKATGTDGAPVVDSERTVRRIKFRNS
jgi:ubiquitin-protein ligase